MDETERRAVMIALAAIGGSLASLWYLPWKTMPWKEIGFAFTVGFAFAIFGVPWIVADLFHVDIQPLRVACGTTFFGAAFGIPIMPRLLRKVEQWLRLNKEDAA